MVKNQIRAFFLKEFTKELILHSKPRDIVLPYHPVKPKIEIVEEPLIPGLRIVPELDLPFPSMEVPLHIKKDFERKLSKGLSVAQMPVRLPQSPSQIIQFTNSRNPNIMNITPIAAEFPPNFTLGRLDYIFQDRNVSAVDCSGPGKFILIKSLGKTSPSQISLTEEEIQQVIGSFSRAARIPMAGGVFKAAVGNLVMTAVTSDFVGSRFVINKYNPLMRY